jgi:2-aminoethylphosphonate-pyruvate transaminase
VAEPLGTALILAAGVGRRLGARGVPQPKGFLEIGGRPIIARSLDCLRDAGIERVVIVTGHHAAHYAALAVPGLAIETVANPHYADSGSLYSWQCAAARLSGAPYLLLESDLVYESRALAALLEDPADSVVLLSGPTGAGDEVWVEVAGPDHAPCLAAMSKRRAALGPRVAGEFVGICKIGPALHAALAAFAAGRLAVSRHADYETDGLVAAAAGMPVACRCVDDLAWGEIDDEAHLARVIREVWPRL